MKKKGEGKSNSQKNQKTKKGNRITKDNRYKKKKYLSCQGIQNNSAPQGLGVLRGLGGCSVQTIWYVLHAKNGKMTTNAILHGYCNA